MHGPQRQKDRQRRPGAEAASILHLECATLRDGAGELCQGRRPRRPRRPNCELNCRDQRANMATATASCATIFSSARHGVRAAVGGAAAASSSRRQAVRHATAAAAMAPGHHHPLAAHAQRMSTSALWRPRAVCSSSVRPLSTSPSRRVPSDDPGGKPIPTDGSYRTVYECVGLGWMGV